MASNIQTGVYRTQVEGRHRAGRRMQRLYMGSLIVAIIVLILLLLNTINQSFGLVALLYEVDPVSLSEQPLEELSPADLSTILVEYVPRRMLVIARDNLRAVQPEVFTRTPLGEAINGEVPEGWEERLITDLSEEEMGQLLALNMSTTELVNIINAEILKPVTVRSWHLNQSLLDRVTIEKWLEDNEPEAELAWKSWISLDFILSPLSNTPANAGIRPALLGSIWLMVITVIVALPLGVGSAIYLNEYASDTWYNRIIETNIRNLAGVPSILYGMLGLAIFVRALEAFTSGNMFGTDTVNGRTIMSAGLTLALLILPIIIVNAQEALRAVPSSIREGSYGLGATKWQTISRQVLPSAIPGILTGAILAMSRAVGETAPLILVGAATYITVDPSGPFSQFTALPILIYSWTIQPNAQFRNIAAAVIIILLVLMLTMNSAAIILRNRAANRRVG